MIFQDYRHFTPIQVRFSDIDRLYHVNNACYHNYVELGRVLYFNQVLQPVADWDHFGFMLARTEMDHLEQTYLDDEVYCFTRALSFGNKSMHMKSSIVKKTPAGLVETAAVRGVLVAMDYHKNESMVVPQEWRKLISGFEGL
jgi:acyl-CoA thioester hydrolase